MKVLQYKGEDGNWYTIETNPFTQVPVDDKIYGLKNKELVEICSDTDSIVSAKPPFIDQGYEVPKNGKHEDFPDGPIYL